MITGELKSRIDRVWDAFVLRWSEFKELDPDSMLTMVRDGVFPWLRGLGGDDSTYSHHMKDALFTDALPFLPGADLRAGMGEASLDWPA